MCHMVSLMILIPEHVNSLMLSEARRHGVDPATLCSGIVAEHFLGISKILTTSTAQRPNPMPASLQSPASRESSVPTDKFDVRRHFPNYPALSVELAEKFVSEALRISGSKAFKAYSGRGIGIEPNFVFIEYLQKSYPGGIGVSFYGKPEDHLHSTLLRPGRNPNYSRAIVCSQEALQPLLQEIRRSHELRFGHLR